MCNSTYSLFVAHLTKQNMDEFYTLSQLAITIAGFAALFSILKQKTGSFELADKINLVRFYMMIELACMMVILCYTPIILSGYFDSETTYRLSSLVLLILNVSYYIFAVKRNKRYSGKKNIGGTTSMILRIVSICGAICAFVNCIGVIGSHFRENYLLLLFVMFIANMYLFIRLIYFSIGQKNTSSELNVPQQ